MPKCAALRWRLNSAGVTRWAHAPGQAHVRGLPPDSQRKSQEVLHFAEAVYHRLADRIRAHMLLCWLALLLIRVAENETGQTWRQLKEILGPLQVGIHRMRSREVWQTTSPTAEQKSVFGTLDVAPPPRYYSLPKPKREVP